MSVPRAIRSLLSFTLSFGLMSVGLLPVGILLGCWDPPELDPYDPPPPDLGSVDTWSAIEDAGLPPDDGAGPEDTAGQSDSSGEPATELDPALTQLRLTEVLVDPEGKDGGLGAAEFVEILNPGPSPVILEGLAVSATSWPRLDSGELGIDGLELDVGEVLIVSRWATDVDPALTELRLEQGVIWTGFQHSSGLRNTDGTIRLEAGTMSIDQLDYGPTLTVPTPGSGKSMCRWQSEADELGDWTGCEPSPGEVPTGADSGSREVPMIAPGSLVITEVLANPPGPASDEKSFEYVEILNLSETPLELSKLRIADSPDILAPGIDPLEYVMGDGGCPSSTCLAPGGRALIVGQGYRGEAGTSLLLSTDDTTLADGGLTNSEPVVLLDQDDTIISSYRLWPDPSGEPSVADEQPLHRVDPTAIDEPDGWISAAPTPGS